MSQLKSLDNVVFIGESKLLNLDTVDDIKTIINNLEKKTSQYKKPMFNINNYIAKKLGNKTYNVNVVPTFIDGGEISNKLASILKSEGFKSNGGGYFTHKFYKIINNNKNICIADIMEITQYGIVTQAYIQIQCLENNEKIRKGLKIQ